ncbi:MAG TPA: hypothetical protein VFT74_16015 [Isosphaeraceae bacterium]|nr:hypothetical protein [Isosphaeraceae bacterium]
MSEYERCAELCEDRGFTRQAALLREVGAGRGRAYAVEMSQWTKEMSHWDVAEEQEAYPESERTQPVFLDREAAEQFALELSAQALRTFALAFPMDPEYFTNLSRDELCERVGEILGRPYHLPEEGEPLIPEPVTDEQLLRIVPLLTLEFYLVVEVDIAI